MRCLARLAAVALPLMLLTAPSHAITEGPDPIGFDVAAATVRGNSLTVDVSNGGTTLLTTDVQARYNDGVKNHDATASVTLKPGETKSVVLSFGTVSGPMPVQTITDDIDPMTTNSCSR